MESSYINAVEADAEEKTHRLPNIADFKLDRSESVFQKHDTTKVRWDLLPYDAMNQVMAVLEHGAVKYGARNWEKGADWSRLFNALQRHLVAWQLGEDNDPQSGMPHMAHIVANALFLIAYAERNLGHDDRPK